MSSAAEAQGYAARLIDMAGLPLKAALPAIARRIGISPRRLKALRYGEATKIGADELSALKAATIKQQVSDAANHASRLEAMAARLAAADPEFHAASIAQAIEQARRLRNLIARGV